MRRLIVAIVLILAGCGRMQNHEGLSSEAAMRSGEAVGARVLVVSVMNLDEAPPLIEAVKIIMALPEGMAVDAASGGVVSVAGAGTLTAGHIDGRTLTLAALAPGGFTGGPDLFRIRVFGEPALATGIRIISVHACGESGGNTYESNACTLASVKLKIE